VFAAVILLRPVCGCPRSCSFNDWNGVESGLAALRRQRTKVAFGIILTELGDGAGWEDGRDASELGAGPWAGVAGAAQ
jgi:hypothetical protein